MGGKEIRKPVFANEAELCARFIANLPEGWRAYPETEGFDIVLVRLADGFQIGVEAKLKLNAKVVCQAAEAVQEWRSTDAGPDCRAALVPHGVGTDFAEVCRLLGITVIYMRADEGKGDGWTSQPFSPQLPSEDRSWLARDWFERCPDKRLPLPDWVPDVAAGCAAPVALTRWKVKAIKVAVILEKRGYVTRADFKRLDLSMSRWCIPGARWLRQDGKGGWIAGPDLPDFRAQHPTNFAEIEVDYEKWSPEAFGVAA